MKHDQTKICKKIIKPSCKLAVASAFIIININISSRKYLLGEELFSVVFSPWPIDILAIIASA